MKNDDTFLNKISVDAWHLIVSTIIFVEYLRVMVTNRYKK